MSYTTESIVVLDSHVKAQDLNLSSEDFTTLVNSLIEQAEDLINGYCRCSFGSTEETEKFNGKGNHKLFVSHPIISVTSVKIDDVDVTSDCIIREEVGIIEYWTSVFTKGHWNIEVQYTYGYSEVPSPVANACLRMVSRALQHSKAKKQSQGMETEKLGDYSYKADSTMKDFFTEEIKLSLREYKTGGIV